MRSLNECIDGNITLRMANTEDPALTKTMLYAFRAAYHLFIVQI